MRGSTPREVSASYWEAECRRDIDAVLEHYHADAVYEDAGGRYEGLAAIRGAYEASARAFPGLEVRILREFPTGTQGALEFHATLVDPSGVRYVVCGVNLVDVRDGRFISVRSYEDPPRPS